MQQVDGDKGYSALFLEYVRRSVRQALAEARAAAAGLPVEQREQALQALAFALDAVDAWPDARDLLVTLAPKLDQAGWREQAVAYLLRGIAVSRATEDEAALAELRLQLAMVYLVLGRLEEARGELAESVAGFGEQGDRSSQARALNRAAYVARSQRRYAEAKELLDAAAALVEPGDAEQVYGDFVAACLAFDERDWLRAQEGYRRALAGWERLGDTTMVARSLTNLGTALRGGGQLEEAVAYYRRAIELMEKQGDEINLANTFMNLGNVYWSSGQPAAALAQYRRAEPVFRTAHDNLRLATLLQNMGLAYFDLGEYESAQAMFRGGIDYQRQLGNVRGEANSMDGLGMVYQAQGQRDAAEATFRKALGLLDTVAGQPGIASLRAEVEEHLAQIGKDCQ